MAVVARIEASIAVMSEPSFRPSMLLVDALGIPTNQSAFCPASLGRGSFGKRHHSGHPVCFPTDGFLS